VTISQSPARMARHSRGRKRQYEQSSGKIAIRLGCVGRRRGIDDRGAQCFHDACKQNEQAIACRPYDMPPILPDFRFDQRIVVRFQLTEGALIIGPHQPAVAHDVGGKYCADPPFGTTAFEPLLLRHLCKHSIHRCPPDLKRFGDVDRPHALRLQFAHP
jgi:hypothetical protein